MTKSSKRLKLNSVSALGTHNLVTIDNAKLERGGRVLWKDLQLAVYSGELIAVLGPNGAGKTSLLKVLLGLLPLNKGTVTIDGRPAGRGNQQIGYIPQQKSFDTLLPIRGRDLVQLGVNGNRYGLGGNNPVTARRVDEAIAAVGATNYADKPIGLLSGGEQQRLRIAQALVGQPELLLCDEPLLSLDIASQRSVVELINGYRKAQNAGVIFVTHEVNPILKYVDRILYMANGRWVIDSPEVVLKSKTLSSLYGAPVEVMKIKGRVLVIGDEDVALAHHEEHA